MARTLVGTLILRLQENISAGAGKAAGALNKLGQSVDNLGRSGSGFSRLRSNISALERDLSRLGSAPWGARMQSQLERLGAGSKDIERVRSEWNKLMTDFNSRSMTKGAMGREITNWRNGVVGHFTAVRLEADKTKRTLASIWRPITVAAGLGAGVYSTGRLGRAGIEADSEFERAKSRAYFSGQTPEDQAKLRSEAIETAQSYRLRYGDTMDTLVDAANNFGSVDKALEVRDTLAAAQSILSNMFGSKAAGDQLRQMTKALDALEIKDPSRVRSVVDNLVKAQAVEGKEFSPEHWALAVKYMRGMKGFVSDDFLTNGLPALVSETSGSDAGTIMQALYRGFGLGRSPVEALKAQAKYGLREGMEFSPKGKMTNKGKLIAAGDFYKNPMLWFFDHALPAMQKAGVDLSDDEKVAEVFGDVTGTGRQQDALTRFLKSKEQYLRKKNEQYPKAKGIDSAKEIPDRDPFAGYKALTDGLSNLTTSIMEAANPAILGAMSNLSTNFNKIAAAIATMDASKMDTFGSWATAIGGTAAVAGGGVLAARGVVSLLAAGPMLITAAEMLQAAAISQGGKGVADTVAKTGIGSWLMSKIPGAARIGGGALGGVLTAGALLEAGKPTSKEAFPYRYDGWDPDAPGILERARRSQDAKKQGQDMEAARGAAFQKIETGSLDEAGAKAKETGALITESLNVTARPNVDTGAIAAARVEVEKLKAALGEVGSMINGIRSGLPSLRGSYSDYGVAP